MSIRGLPVLVLLSALLPVSAQELTEQLRQALMSGGYHDAIEQGLQGLQDDPADTGLLLQLGRLEARVGRYADAEKRFDRIVELGEGPLLAARFELAELLRLRGQQAQADDLYRQVRAAWAELQRPSVEQLYAIARATHRLGRHDSARY